MCIRDHSFINLWRNLFKCLCLSYFLQKPCSFPSPMIYRLLVRAFRLNDIDFTTLMELAQVVRSPPCYKHIILEEQSQLNFNKQLPKTESIEFKFEAFFLHVELPEAAISFNFSPKTHKQLLLHTEMHTRLFPQMDIISSVCSQIDFSVFYCITEIYSEIMMNELRFTVVQQNKKKSIFVSRTMFSERC